MIQAPPKPQQLPASSAPIASIPLPHPYGAGLTQPINMDILRNMAALYQQQMSQNNHQALMSSCMSQPHLEQGRVFCWSRIDFGSVWVLVHVSGVMEQWRTIEFQGDEETVIQVDEGDCSKNSEDEGA
ncbi:hypothetical protein JHK87_010309 [Glycine soja]|nr:hypothetical protein JHK87_010309 [Glycine soja]